MNPNNLYYSLSALALCTCIHPKPLIHGHWTGSQLSLPLFHLLLLTIDNTQTDTHRSSISSLSDECWAFLRLYCHSQYWYPFTTPSQNKPFHAKPSQTGPNQTVPSGDILSWVSLKRKIIIIERLLHYCIVINLLFCEWAMFLLLCNIFL